MPISNNVKEVLKRYQVSTSVTKTTVLQQFFILCYSIISPCSYWNSNTLDAIIKNGSQLKNTMQSKHCLTSITLPDSVTIFGTNINVHINEVSNRELSNLTESRISFETLMLRNHTGKKGFLMWISSHCIACICQQNTKVKQLFSLLTYEDSHSHSPAE